MREDRAREGGPVEFVVQVAAALLPANEGGPEDGVLAGDAEDSFVPSPQRGQALCLGARRLGHVVHRQLVEEALRLHRVVLREVLLVALRLHRVVVREVVRQVVRRLLLVPRRRQGRRGLVGRVDVWVRVGLALPLRLVGLLLLAQLLVQGLLRLLRVLDGLEGRGSRGPGLGAAVVEQVQALLLGSDGCDLSELVVLLLGPRCW